MELKLINEKIGNLRTAEGQVKSLVSELIIAVTERIHLHDDVTTANAFLLALTPINQKKAVSFLKAFSGHKIEEGILSTRRKVYVDKGEKIDPYKEASDAFEQFKATGMNFWQWAVASKKKEETVITLDEVTKKAKKARDAMAEAIQAGVVNKVQAFELVTGGVFSQQDMMEILRHMAQAEQAVTQTA